MIELSIIFVVIFVILSAGASLLLLSKTSAPQAPPPSAFTDTGFLPTQMYMNNAGGAGIALNESSKTLCVIQSSALPPQLVHFTDLIATFVLQNETIIHKTLRSHPKELSSVANDFHNTLTSGAGKESSSLHLSDQTQKIDLYLIIHDQENPLHIVNFLDMDTKEGGILFNKAMASAKHWYQLLSDLIQQANGETGHPDSSLYPNDNSQTSAPTEADELTKLRDLLNNKVISQEDYNEAKEKLFARQ